MTAKFSHDAEPASAHFPFDGPTNIVHTIPRTSGFGGVMESTLSASNQSVCRFRDFTDSHGDSGIRKEAVLFSHKIKLHKIASLQELSGTGATVGSNGVTTTGLGGVGTNGVTVVPTGAAGSTSGSTLLNGTLVGALVVGTFEALISIVNTGVLW